MATNFSVRSVPNDPRLLLLLERLRLSGGSRISRPGHALHLRLPETEPMKLLEDIIVALVLLVIMAAAVLLTSPLSVYD